MVKEEKKILVVDNDENGLDDITTLLKQKGYEVENVKQEAEGIYKVRRNGFGAVVTNKPTLAEKVKFIEGKEKLPVILCLESDTINPEISELYKDEIIDHLIYPYPTQKEFLECIRNSLKKINVGIVGVGNVGKSTLEKLAPDMCIQNIYLLGDTRKPKKEENIEQITAYIAEITRTQYPKFSRVNKRSLHVCESLDDILNTDILIVSLKGDYDYRGIKDPKIIRYAGLIWDLESIQSLARGLHKKNYQGTILMISNPVSIFCYEFVKAGFNPKKVFGSSTDSDRLLNLIQKYYNSARTVNLIDESDIFDCMVIGDHKCGAMIPIFSNIQIKDPDSGVLGFYQTKLIKYQQQINQELNSAGLETIYPLDGAVAPMETSTHIRNTLKDIIYNPSNPKIIIAHYQSKGFNGGGAYVALPTIFNEDLTIKKVYEPDLLPREKKDFLKVFRGNLKLTNEGNLQNLIRSLQKNL